MTTANIIEELGRIEEWIADLAENEDLSGSDYREDMPGMAQQLYAIRYAIELQGKGSIQQRIDDILDGEYENLKRQALAICKEKELDHEWFVLNDSVEMEEVDEQESWYVEGFDFSANRAFDVDGHQIWLWQEMGYGQKLDILQEIKESIQKLLNPTT